MDPQALVNALTEQRNSALNQAAQAVAYASALEAHVKELEDKLAELSSEEKEDEVKD